ncbi:hypothetical protein N7470_009587 [Penicillium chermesinum]|nr:hypothetical protein N7470_009587 [Penicillium chermesinum]
MPQAKVVAESRSTISETCQSCATSKVRCIRDPETPQTCQRRIEALESKVRELTAAQTASGDVPSQVFACAANKLSTSTATGLDVIDQGLLGLQTAADYLQAFKSDLVTNFPFVVVPPQTSAPQLRIEKPFLFLAILASASYKNLSLQRSLGAELRKVVALRMIMGGESSFDLLQGLLVYLAW